MGEYECLEGHTTFGEAIVLDRRFVALSVLSDVYSCMRDLNQLLLLKVALNMKLKSFE